MDIAAKCSFQNNQLPLGFPLDHLLYPIWSGQENLTTNGVTLSLSLSLCLLVNRDLNEVEPWTLKPGWLADSLRD